MIICPACKHENLPGVLYCEECAELLQRPINIPSEEIQHYLESLPDDKSWGYLKNENGLWLLIQPEMFFSQRSRLIRGRLLLGRLDSSEEYTTLKLDVPRVEELGVSRLHAALVPLEHGVGLQDVGSTNGTRLNGQQLAKGRTYNLNHQDSVDLGKLPMQVHFIDLAVFLDAIRATLVKQFAPPIQELLAQVDIPGEALNVLLERLPGKAEAQFQVLRFFLDRHEPITLEQLHQVVNKVMGDPSRPLRPQVLDGEDTQALDKLPVDEAESKAAAALQKKQTHVPESSSVSALTEVLLTRLYKDGLKMERVLQAYLKEAQRLPSEPERQEAINMITPILIQMNTWLPSLESVVHSGTKMLKPRE